MIFISFRFGYIITIEVIAMKNPENAKIGFRIRSMREYQKLSREKLAEKANISTQFLADIECGNKGMTVSTLKKICKALCVTSDSIVFGTENESEKNFAFLEMLETLPTEKQAEIEDLLQRIIRLIK